MNKIPWNEPTYGEKRTIYRKLRDTDERQNKEMEGYSMLLGGIFCNRLLTVG